MKGNNIYREILIVIFFFSGFIWYGGLKFIPVYLILLPVYAFYVIYVNLYRYSFTEEKCYVGKYQFNLSEIDDFYYKRNIFRRRNIIASRFYIKLKNKELIELKLFYPFEDRKVYNYLIKHIKPVNKIKFKSEDSNMKIYIDKSNDLFKLNHKEYKITDVEYVSEEKNGVSIKFIQNKKAIFINDNRKNYIYIVNFFKRL